MRSTSPWRVVYVAPVAFLLLSASHAHAQSASKPTKQMSAADLKEWKNIRNPVLSNDGKWFAYVLAPNEGNADVVVRSLGDGKETKYPIGDASAGGGRGGPPGAPTGDGGPLVISGDSKWVAFTVYPNAAPTGANGRGGRGGGGRGGAPGAANAGATTPPAQNKMMLVNVASGEKREFDRVRRFSFNGDKPAWIAMQSFAPTPAAGATPPPANGTGTDLVLYNLVSHDAVNVGNVAEYSFDDDGEYLAYTIDARDQIGNGVQLRNMKTDVVRAIDSDHGLYRSLAWADTNQALTVLRGKADTTAHDTLYSVVAFTNISAPQPKKLVFDAAEHRDFPSGMKVAAERAPRLSEDLQTIFFGIKEKKNPATVVASRGGNIVQAGAPGMGGTINQPRVNEAQEENPTLILWNAKDPRLQSQQIVQEAQDRTFSYLSEYRISDNKVVRLSDDALRTVNVFGHDRFAYGVDQTEYEQAASYNGRRYQDVYGIDLTTGAKKSLLKKHITPAFVPSPSGGQM